MRKLLSNLCGFFSRSRKEVIKTTVIGKAMLEGSQLENKRRLLLRELGELAYNLRTEGEIKNKDVEKLCRKINLLNTKIKERESKIDEVKRDEVIPH